MKLPETHYQTQFVDLSLDERNLYEDILQKSVEEIDDAVSNKSSTKTYNSILRAILCTRMIYNQGTLHETASRCQLEKLEGGYSLTAMQDGDEGMLI